MIDLGLGVLSEFAERQRLAPAVLSFERAGLRYFRRSTPEYFTARRAELKTRGRCANCPALAVPKRTRCAACAAERAKKERDRRRHG